MAKIKKTIVYLLLVTTLIIVGCEGGCDQESPTSPEKSKISISIL
jgi:uncharacterized lipoprotein NlpE involved in copper resistance